jgi:hypothetical protein
VVKKQDTTSTDASGEERVAYSWQGAKISHVLPTYFDLGSGGEWQSGAGTVGWHNVEWNKRPPAGMYNAKQKRKRATVGEVGAFVTDHLPYTRWGAETPGCVRLQHLHRVLWARPAQAILRLHQRYKRTALIERVFQARARYQR